MKSKTNDQLLKELRDNMSQAPFNIFSNKLSESFKLLKECLKRGLLEEYEISMFLHKLESYKKPYIMWF